jgi:hypothetical protein
MGGAVVDGRDTARSGIGGEEGVAMEKDGKDKA